MPNRGHILSRNHCADGFTLVELVLVVAIIGIISVIAVPRLSNSIARQRVDAAARRIIVDLALAQRQAKSSNAEQRVRFYPSNGEYVLINLPDPDHSANDYTVRLGEEPYAVTLVSADFGGQDRIIFDIFGVPDSGGTIVISVGNLVRTIVVDADTGKATVP